MWPDGGGACHLERTTSRLGTKQERRAPSGTRRFWHCPRSGAHLRGDATVTRQLLTGVTSRRSVEASMDWGCPLVAITRRPRWDGECGKKSSAFKRSARQFPWSRAQPTNCGVGECAARGGAAIDAPHTQRPPGADSRRSASRRNGPTGPADGRIAATSPQAATGWRFQPTGADVGPGRAGGP